MFSTEEVLPVDVPDAKIVLTSVSLLYLDFSVFLDIPGERMLFDLKSQMHRTMKVKLYNWLEDTHIIYSPCLPQSANMRIMHL